MKVINRPLQPRVDNIKSTFQRELQLYILAQKWVDLVMTRPVVYLHDKGKAECNIYPYVPSYDPKNGYANITFYFEQIDLETFIEGILGPLHRRKGLTWDLTFDGEEDDPVFVYRPREETDNVNLNFRVKEGEFKSCRVKKLIKKAHTPQPRSTYYDYEYEMECI